MTFLNKEQLFFGIVIKFSMTVLCINVIELVLNVLVELKFNKIAFS